ncbi:MAG: Asp23/Gls24 family envelope stress response protein [Clostridiales bacterium]|nr:Asp23/Gls24 family envelope stress response protein [Clostridiales bacterium]MBP3940797.1 Asp23/Gls24 family envelope stress response protein [Christensenellaceae bacterium]MBR2223691.1 Asp23/Gls24 family envelope stress response protein [Christensenellaceae bacterium]MBR3843706.1 Asp23/Gls24 family envelope stress response protein [Christensenellaceae bacterium]
MSEIIKEELEVQGSITFANEVLATIAGIAAADIPGVAGMTGGFKDGVVEMIGKKSFTKGVKVVVAEGAVTVDVAVILDYGVKAPEVCKNIQTSVAKALDIMTGLKVNAVNVAVQGVKFKEIATTATVSE